MGEVLGKLKWARDTFLVSSKLTTYVMAKIEAILGNKPEGLRRY